MATNTDIQKMYIAYFGRAADVSGLAYWTNQVTLANSSEAVINAFSASAEYADNYAGKSNEFIVNSLYNNLFGRDAEVDGLLYWTAKLNDGTFSVGNVAWAIMVGAQNEDVLALGNKATAAQAFTDAMDTTDEIIGYSGADAAAEAKAWLATVTDDSATLTAALATVDTAVADAVAASDVNAGQTFMLTTNVDTITGTAGNDIIIGEDLQLNGANIQSFGALDSIDGGAGADTLKILDQNNAINVAGSNVSNVETVIIQGAAAVTANTTNWTGVETLNVTQSGGAVAATAAATTDINVSGAVLGAGTLATTNGKDVSVTHAGVNGTAEGAISVNGAAGAVSVTTTN
ncbi:DUF4214 domain-containing protein [Sulfurimonas sp.]|jgi:hypothetical protein|uniref:DUF4214 domain-containing protein n=1 Tax=Sulfurimonas sp. TaxID=2022749 RepID=UPI002A359E3D|nr:DUF4214 domain-containing protein [Sulfurimonas sp.]MDY0122971.1 DUF4214 domain-containing protein [Sulfurimonas sp.]